jgi:hypothetical protein
LTVVYEINKRHGIVPFWLGGGYYDLFSGTFSGTATFKFIMSDQPTGTSSPKPANRHAPTAVERQRLQLEKLLKDPSKPAYVAPALKPKTIRPAREMMKNVQGSSAGAGSGEFHVYKASRRREYERLKLLDEMSQKVNVAATFSYNT